MLWLDILATTAPSDFRTHALLRLWIPAGRWGTTPDQFGPLSSQSVSFDMRRPLRPRRVHRLHLSAASPVVLASSTLTAWPLSIGVSRLIWVRLSLRLTSSPDRGFAAKDYSRRRPAGYMANGSFHDELLSVHKTQMVSLTHQRNAEGGSGGSTSYKPRRDSASPAVNDAR